MVALFLCVCVGVVLFLFVFNKEEYCVWRMVGPGVGWWQSFWKVSSVRGERRVFQGCI